MVSLGRAIRGAYVRSGIRRVLPTTLKNGLRRRWVRVARNVGYPISTPHRPRPHLERPRRFARLTHVLLASDLNPRYLESWELVRRAWPAVAGVEPVLVLVADAESAPRDLLDDPHVRLFEPLPGIHTAFQAQCIRLLYPALLDAAGAVLISDMELVPIDPRYFHAPLARLDDRFFVAYRDVFLHRSMVSVPYNAARPETWREVFGVETPADVRARLREWSADIRYTGERGGPGWYTDQHVLYRLLMPWAERTDRLWMLDDDHTGFNRLERPEPPTADWLSDTVRRAILARRYTDYNSAVPHSEHRELNEPVLELALRSLRHAPRTGGRRKVGAAST